MRQDHGRGIYDNWPEASSIVHAFNNALYKGFNSLSETEKFMCYEAPELILAVNYMFAF